jgi:hypothetical protein
LANSLWRGLIDEKIASVGFGIRVPGHDLNAALAGLTQGRRDGFAIFDGNGDRVDAARDPSFDDLVLLGGIGIGRAQALAELARKTIVQALEILTGCYILVQVMLIVASDSISSGHLLALRFGLSSE